MIKRYISGGYNVIKVMSTKRTVLAVHSDCLEKLDIAYTCIPPGVFLSHWGSQRLTVCAGNISNMYFQF